MTIYDENGRTLLDIEVNDDSYRFREVMGKDEVTLTFALTSHMELPLGSYVILQGHRYVLMEPEQVTIRHRRDYEYTVTLGGPSNRLSKYRVHNMVNGRLKFDLIDNARNHLKQIIDNLNEREGADTWTVAVCVDTKQKLISYNHTSILDALNAIAETFETEWEVNGTTITVNKIEYFKDAPLPLSYGKGNGFRPDVARSNPNGMPVQKLYVQGGERNIVLSSYGSPVLVLPKSLTFRFDGKKFEGEPGYDSAKGVQMVTDEKGYSVRLADAPDSCTEDSLDLSHIYPKREGTVSDVRFVYKGGYYTLDGLQQKYPSLTKDDWDQVQVDIVDKDIPPTLDYSAKGVQIDNEKLNLIFQSGSLSGREFDVNFIKEQSASGRPGNRIELVKTTIDGVGMPTRGFLPSVGDKYAIFNCYLPEDYLHAIREDGTREGAEYDMLRDASKYLYENRNPKFVFRGTLDTIWAKRNWDTISAYMKPGAFIRFTDSSVQTENFDVRIVSIKDYINRPHMPEIELSNETRTTGVVNAIKTLDAEKVHTESLIKSARNYTRRSFKQAEEILGSVGEAFSSQFGVAINPVTIRTMGILVGTEQQQFKVMDRRFTSFIDFPFTISGEDQNVLTTGDFGIRHYTIGVTDASISPVHDDSIYRRWVFEPQTITFEDERKPYYLYARVDRTGDGGTGTLLLSATPLDLDGSDCYNLLVGIFSSRISDGENLSDRSFAPMYGYSQILPNQILTGSVRSEDGKTVFDLEGGVISLNDMSGMSGTPEEGKSQNLSIASWWGGQRIDLEKLLDGQSADSAASALVRFDGTGYFARGNFSWDSDGAGKLAGGKISWTKNGDITLSPTVKIGGTESDTLDSILTAIGRLMSWFKFDEVNKAVYTEYDLYSQKSLSAFGRGESGTGGTVGGLLTDWSDYDESKMSDFALSAVLGKQLKDLIGGGSRGTNVRWSSSLTSGQQIGTLTIDDVPFVLYAPRQEEMSLENLTGAEDLKAIESLTGGGLLRRDGEGSWRLDTSPYITGNQTITLRGDVTGSGSTAITVNIGQGKILNSMLSGGIANNKLENSEITIGRTRISLGSTVNAVSFLNSGEVNWTSTDSKSVTMLTLTSANVFLIGDKSYGAMVNASTLSLNGQSQTLIQKGSENFISLSGSRVNVHKDIALVADAQRICFGSESRYINYDVTGRFHMTDGLWSEGEVTAFGVGENDGSNYRSLGGLLNVEDSADDPSGENCILVMSSGDVSWRKVRVSDVFNFGVLSGARMETSHGGVAGQFLVLEFTTGDSVYCDLSVMSSAALSELRNRINSMQNTLDGLLVTIGDIDSRTAQVFYSESEWENLTNGDTDYSEVPDGMIYIYEEEEGPTGGSTYDPVTGVLTLDGQYDSTTGTLRVNGTYDNSNGTLTI